MCVCVRVCVCVCVCVCVFMHVYYVSAYAALCYTHTHVFIIIHNNHLMCPPSQNVNVKDFRQSWSDGMAFCAILHSFLPDKIPFDDLSPDDPKANLTLAFDVAK